MDSVPCQRSRLERRNRRKWKPAVIDCSCASKALCRRVCLHMRARAHLRAIHSPSHWIIENVTCVIRFPSITASFTHFDHLPSEITGPKCKIAFVNDPNRWKHTGGYVHYSPQPNRSRQHAFINFNQHLTLLFQRHQRKPKISHSSIAYRSRHLR